MVHGKAAIASKLGGLMQKGTVVLAIDARGFGETEDKVEAAREDNRTWFGDASSTSSAFLLGEDAGWNAGARHHPGLRATVTSRTDRRLKTIRREWG